MGNMLAWSSPALPHLENCAKTNSCDLPVEFTEDEGGWIGSVATLGALVASQVIKNFHLNATMSKVIFLLRLSVKLCFPSLVASGA